MAGEAQRLPDFTEDGLLPAGDYVLTLDEIQASIVVVGPSGCSSSWDSAWRAKLVDNLAVLVGQLSQVGIREIYVNGSFVEDKDHPNDIDGYFVCELQQLSSGQLERELNLLDPFKIWTWDPASRRPY